LQITHRHGRVANRLKFPQKTDQLLGSRRDTWCDFHRAYGHDIEGWIALSYQLANLVKKGFLEEYIKVGQEESKGEAISLTQTHETPMHGDLNTIAGGFFGGGNTDSKRKRYARTVMSLNMRKFDHPT